MPTKYLSVVLLFFLAACQSAQAAGQSEASTAADAKAIVTIDGTTHVLDDLDWVSSTVTDDEDEIKFYLTQRDFPVSINLNIKKDVLSENESAVFNIPDVNRSRTGIELSFYDLTREGTPMKKRVVFTEGSIDFLEYRPGRLRITFAGSGGVLLASEKFAIEGMIDIEY